MIGMENIGQRWRQMRFNPLVSLTPARLTAALDSWAAGWLRDAGLIFEAIEEREAIVAGVLQKRAAAVARRDWEIVVPDPDHPNAEAHKQALEFFYDNLTVTDATDLNVRSGMSGLLRQMMSATVQRYAVHEIVWQPREDGLTAEMRFVPIYFFENRSGRLRFTGPEMRSEGTPLEDGGWLVTVAKPLGIALSILYMYRRLGMQDWVAYSEKFSIPGVLGRTNAKAGTAEATAFEDAVEKFGSEWTATITGDDGSIPEPLKILAHQGGAAMPQKELVEYCDRMIAALVRGSDLSTISADTRGVTLQADEGRILLEDDCQMISESLQWLDRAIIRNATGDETPAAYVEIRPPSAKDLTKELAIDNGLVALGVIQDPEDIAERYGRTIKIQDSRAKMQDGVAENYSHDQPRIPRGESGGGQWSDDPRHGGNDTPYRVERKLRKQTDANVDRWGNPQTELEPDPMDLATRPQRTAEEIQAEKDLMEKDRLAYEAELREEAMSEFPEISKTIKRRIPLPQDMDPNDPMRGEVQRIYDRFKKETRRRVRTPGSILPGKFIIRADAADEFFAPRGSAPENLDYLREEMNQQGFDFETPAQMLEAVYESLEGRKQYGTRSRGIYAGNEASPAADALRAALGEDFSKVGAAIEAALAAGDGPAFRAAMAGLSVNLPDLAGSQAMEAFMSDEMVRALAGDDSETF